ncbi:hypothetical protein BCR35DRAFT_116003 [Leucosporidium creatinivorum]|uniref:Uncharacterized protein n=1 Tax=Leucosporidium creatinivorum TaxID=106004 RepID=A0A1Y2F025_9BASI|nr:hypothetical protein BCR35DRAFT_116003 [Leucosporidium creatinivorum]
MFSSPTAKRSRDEDEHSSAKRTRVFGEYDHAQQLQMPAFQQPNFFQPQQQSAGAEMSMDQEMGMEVEGAGAAQFVQQGGFTQADLSNPAHQWNAAPRMAHQFSTTSLSSVATSTMPSTPVDEDYLDEDLYGDFTCPRPAPYYEDHESTYPSESNPMAFTNVNGYTTIFPAPVAPSPFPGSTPTKAQTEGEAFANYAYGHGFPQNGQIARTDLGGNEMTCDGALAYNWDAPRQHGHMV